MSPTRTINVLTLTAILLLAGCFGFGDSAEADDSDDPADEVTVTVTTQDLTDAMLLAANSPPELTVKKFDLPEEFYNNETNLIANNWEYSGLFYCTDEEFFEDDDADIGDTLEEQRASLAEDLEDGESVHLANVIEVGDCMIWLDFLSVDPDGDSMTKGIDTDFDGTIDIPIVPNDGMTIISIDNSTNKGILNWWWGTDTANGCEQIDLAFIAVDEHGASTVEFIHFLGMSSCDDDDNDDYDDGGSLDMYYFSDRDAAGTMSDAGGEDLVHIAMTQGNDLSWALLKVSIIVDGGPSMVCDEAADADADSSCTYTTDSDNYWSVSEEITISEGAADLCDGSDNGGCNVEIILTKVGVGSEDDRVISFVNAYADGAN